MKQNLEGDSPRVGILDHFPDLATGASANQFHHSVGPDKVTSACHAFLSAGDFFSSFHFSLVGNPFLKKRTGHHLSLTEVRPISKGRIAGRPSQPIVNLHQKQPLRRGRFSGQAAIP